MKQGEGERVVEPLMAFLTNEKHWYCIKIHGSMFQCGLPDLFICHAFYQPRWVECKIKGGSFTPAQKARFPILISLKVPIYLVEHEDLRGNRPALESIYNLIIMGEPNCKYKLML